MKNIDRIQQVIENKGISIRAFELEIGASNGTISRAIQKKTDISSVWLSKIIDKYPNVNAEWLLSGNGFMLKSDDISFQNDILTTPPSLNRINNSRCATVENQKIPLYDISAAAGIAALFSDNHTVPLDYINIPNLSKIDGAVYVVGDSMYPILKSGDIILIKQVHNFEYISYGDMYLLSFSFDDEDYVCVKYIQKSSKEGYIKLVSHNQHHNDQEIPISSLRALAMVRASIRYNYMG